MTKFPRRWWASLQRFLFAPRHEPAQRWVQARGLESTAVIIDALAVRFSRRRRYAFFGALPFLAAAFFGVEWIADMSPWLLAAIAALIGLLVADARAERADSAKRVARLQPRRARDYAPRAGFTVLWTLSAAAVLTTPLTALIDDRPANPWATGVTALLLFGCGPGVTLALRSIARRPATATTVAGSEVDEALRRQSGHAVVAAAATLLFLLVAARLQGLLSVAGDHGGSAGALLMFVATPAVSAATILGAVTLYNRLSRADVIATAPGAPAPSR